MDNPEKYLKNAKLQHLVKAEKDGYITEMDAKLCGQAAVLLGAGRGKMEDEIDYGAGIWLEKKYGDAVKKGDVIARIYASDKKRLAAGSDLFLQALTIKKSKAKKEPIVREIIK